MERKRGRPRKYDPEIALDAALTLFWTRGYAATTLDALSEATGMQRPSLYAAFGDKSELFAQALGRFQQRMSQTLGAVLEQDPLDTALAELLVGVVDVYAPGDEPARGCFVFSVAALEAVEHPTTRAAVAKVVDALDERLRRRFERAVSAGELPAHCDVLTLARLSSAAVHSISLRARSGSSRRALRAFARASAAMLLSAARA
ncbi:MAG: TetR/AcrR family transcriptional regulator [Myxococcales bacterium]|nr:TetR/AcrR family transcriptional regulator [Myxococcales bacterium]